MTILRVFCLPVLIGLAIGATAAQAASLCASDEQALQIREFYAQNPGVMPVMASRRLQIPEALVASTLGPELAVSVPGSAFAEVWSLMSTWQQANFLITKGQNVFEILSGVSAGAPSKISKNFNLEYTHPLRGHLRPDLYAAIYALAMPAKDGKVVRGVAFYDEQGELVFAAFISGESLEPSAADLTAFDRVMQLMRSKTPVCPVPAAG